MALHTLTEQGNMGWICPHCQRENTAHITHEQVEHPAIEEIETTEQGRSVDELGLMHIHLVTGKTGKKIVNTDMVALPPCECGARTFLKASFTPEELSAHNMVDEDDKATESHATAHRHMQLVRRMKEIGKAPYK